MFQKSTVLLSALVLLAIVLVGEAMYYVLLPEQKPPAGFGQQNQFTPKTNSGNFQNSNAAIPESSINYLSTLNKGLTKSSLAMNEYQGRVLARVNETGWLPYSESQYKMYLSFVGKEKNISTLFFTDQDLSKLEIVRQEGVNEIPIAINEINAEDEIIVQETLDLLKDMGQNRLKIKIIKVQN